MTELAFFVVPAKIQWLMPKTCRPKKVSLISRKLHIFYSQHLKWLLTMNSLYLFQSSLLGLLLEPRNVIVMKYKYKTKPKELLLPWKLCRTLPESWAGMVIYLFISVESDIVETTAKERNHKLLELFCFLLVFKLYLFVEMGSSGGLDVS